jgi:hypothetical protein
MTSSGVRGGDEMMKKRIDLTHIPYTVVALVIACIATTREAHANPPAYLVGFRAGTAQEAQQGTLKGGAELGLVFDWVTGRALDVGIGIATARDPGGGSYLRDRVTISSVEAHTRTSLAKRHPYLEGGLGFYRIVREATDPSVPARADQNSPGAFAGIGYELRTAKEPGFGLGIGLAYHMMFTEISYSGNLDDYYTFAATVRWAHRTR